MSTSQEVKNKEVRFLLAIKAGHNIEKACEAAGVSRQWYYHRRRQNPEFAAEASDILSRPVAQRSEIDKQSIEDWMHLFIEAFVESGGVKREAASVVGRPETEIYALLNPMHPKYSKVFADEVAKAENMVAQKLLDVAHEKAMSRDNNMIIQCLKWLDPERFDNKKVTAQLPYQIDVRVTSEDVIREKFNDFIEAQFTTREQIPDSTRADTATG